MTTAELIAVFERAFICCVGPQQAYFDLPNGRSGLTRLTYATYAVAAEDVEDAEGLLCASFAESFWPVLDAHGNEGHVLFWRHPWKIRFGESQERQYGAVLATAEQVEDGAPVPSGSVFEPISGTWCEDLGIRRIARLESRLVIPAAVEASVGIAKAEGAATLRVAGPHGETR
ncbi:MAG: hypothetical protein IT514_15465 [Burkholderiales bacterium]|nr:hypothetical protein [Burkholderiales bacterium]